MPKVVDNTVKQGRDNLFDGAKYGLGRGLGLRFAGPIGYGIGGVAAAATMDEGSEREVLSTMAIADTLTLVANLNPGAGGARGGVR